MGLTLNCKGSKVFRDKFGTWDSIDIGYIGFTQFRLGLAEAIDEELGSLYERWIKSASPWAKVEKLTKEEFERMKELAGDSFILLAHSDCDGMLTPKESRLLYKKIEDVDFEWVMTSVRAKGTDFFKVLKDMLYYSWKNRKRISFQ